MENLRTFYADDSVVKVGVWKDGDLWYGGIWSKSRVEPTVKKEYWVDWNGGGWARTRRYKDQITAACWAGFLLSHGIMDEAIGRGGSVTEMGSSPRVRRPRILGEGS